MSIRNNVLVCVSILGVPVTGCSTISFFPQAPAQKAADKVIDDVWPVPPAPTKAAPAEVRK
jgi:hypothetical protein